MSDVIVRNFPDSPDQLPARARARDAKSQNAKSQNAKSQIARAMQSQTLHHNSPFKCFGFRALTSFLAKYRIKALWGSFAFHEVSMPPRCGHFGRRIRVQRCLFAQKNILLVKFDPKSRLFGHVFARVIYFWYLS